MATSITTIQETDVISTSRTTINDNFSSLNTNKIETSYLDTDTTLAANSDAKVATQKAVKAYVDAGGNINASETTRGIVEEATDAEVTAGTATGGTGAKLFVTPAKLVTQAFAKTADLPTEQYTVGALRNALVKTYFNVQLLFILWVGAVVNDTTTTFANWIRSSTDANVSLAFTYFSGTGVDYIYLDPFKVSIDILDYNTTNIVILDWWARLPASGTGDISMGFTDGNANGSTTAVYNSSAYDRVVFAQKGTGELYATISSEAVGVTNTDISSGLTLTNWNNYRIELDLSNNALFYVNGVLKATLSGANFPASATAPFISFGRSDTSLFTVTAPNLSLQMNP